MAVEEPIDSEGALNIITTANMVLKGMKKKENPGPEETMTQGLIEHAA